MTTLSKAALQALFQQGDVPSGTDYANLIDSQINVAETSVQAMQGALNPTELITPRVSATNVNVTGTLTAPSLVLTNASFTTVSATSAILGTVSADIVYSTNGVIQSVGIVSAAGTAQSTAAPLNNIINRLRGIADGQTTGFTPLANKAGLVQYVLNEGPSANLWPPTGGFINGLAVNTPFALGASAAYTVFHVSGSAYGVK